MNPMMALRLAKIGRRYLKYLPIVLGIAILPSLMMGVIVLAVIGWLFSPFQGQPPPGGTSAILTLYRPLEDWAVEQYSGCYQVQVSEQSSGGKLIGEKQSWRIRGIDVPFVQAVMTAESDGDAKAISDAGALGLMQVTIGKFDLTKGVSPLDPKTNVLVGTKFLNYLNTLFPGNLPLIAAAYNAGPGRAQQWVTEYGTTDWSTIASHPAVQQFAKGQTYNYVSEVMGYYAQYTSDSNPTQTCTAPSPPASSPNGSLSAGGG